MNGELVRGPFTYSLSGRNAALVNGRQIYPRQNPLLDPSDDFEIADIHFRSGQDIAMLSEDGLGETDTDNGRQLIVDMHSLEGAQIALIEKRRALATLKSVQTAIEGGGSCVIMEKEGWELRFQDPERKTLDGIRQVLRLPDSDAQKAVKINSMLSAPPFVKVGDSIVANAASWL